MMIRRPRLSFRYHKLVPRCLPHPSPVQSLLLLLHKRPLSSLGPSSIVQATELGLECVHQWSHLPWWGVIVGTTLVLRVGVTLPLAVHQMRLASKQELLLPRLKELQEATLHNVVVRCRKANLPHTEANRIFQKEVGERGRGWVCNTHTVQPGHHRGMKVERWPYLMLM